MARRRSADETSHIPLRERKKARAQASIQREAMRLFAENGYEATTVDEISEAAEVSRATFFRYFPTKADLVLHDIADLMVIDALPEHLDGTNLIGALRGAVTTLVDTATAEQHELNRQREELLCSVPDLRARVPGHIAAALPLLTEALARRLGRPTDDLHLLTVSGAVIGVAIAAWNAAANDLSEGFAQRRRRLLDDALAHLESGLPPWSTRG
ncbi:TetR family transcriptional regulator [Streptosporangium roseum]|uniref:Transcriptional regulator, TetR family n=1 Tax=Streptosporangium roseum (strain ATCC 12428 / DSM 43021 / JCM 3005 / KCTC 9067 / NCIMB 10171 / NRRL 2505 / NI 9100) TaxID=479432 RepID=D2AZD8_STRRD|nr:TetR family transcriptional regulator [Streptosporangium roseum]ACZ83323.1 putative transcriptional regulator, TetR family [Streptosporangium roseum DSM 43021]